MLRPVSFGWRSPHNLIFNKLCDPEDARVLPFALLALKKFFVPPKLPVITDILVPESTKETTTKLTREGPRMRFSTQRPSDRNFRFSPFSRSLVSTLAACLLSAASIAAQGAGRSPGTAGRPEPQRPQGRTGDSGDHVGFGLADFGRGLHRRRDAFLVEYERAFLRVRRRGPQRQRQRHRSVPTRVQAKNPSSLPARARARAIFSKRLSA